MAQDHSFDLDVWDWHLACKNAKFKNDQRGTTWKRFCLPYIRNRRHFGSNLLLVRMTQHYNEIKDLIKDVNFVLSPCLRLQGLQKRSRTMNCVRMWLPCITNIMEWEFWGQSCKIPSHSWRATSFTYVETISNLIQRDANKWLGILQFSDMEFENNCMAWTGLEWFTRRLELDGLNWLKLAWIGLMIYKIGTRSS